MIVSLRTENACTVVQRHTRCKAMFQAETRPGYSLTQFVVYGGNGFWKFFLFAELELSQVRRTFSTNVFCVDSPVPEVSSTTEINR